MQIRPDSLFARYAERAAARAEGASTHQTDGPNFFELMKDGVGKVNDMQQSSTVQVEQLLTGEDVQSAEVMTSLQKADMAFRLLVQIRNKLMDAYQELNNIRV